MIKKLQEKKASLQTELETLMKEVESNTRAFTDEENTKFAELEKEINDIKETLNKLGKGRELTQEEPKENTTNTANMTEEQRALEEEKNDVKTFADFVRNKIQERADSNLTAGENGDIIPTTIAKKIITKVYDMSPVLEKTTKYNTKGKLEIPVYGVKADGSDITMAYSDEFTDLQAKIGQFTTIELTGFLAGALAKLSNSLINNTDIDLVNKVIELIAESTKRFLEKEALIGTVGKATGCSDINLSQITATATVLTADDLVKVKNKIKQAFRKSSIWIMNQDTLTAIQLLKDANDRFLFTEDLTGEFDGKILGYPVYVSDSMPAIGAGSSPIYFGDFSGLALKQTQEVEIKVLRELYAAQHATGIMAWTEFDIKIEHYQKLAKLVMASA